MLTEEAALVNLAAAGDKEAQGVLYRTHYFKLYATALRLTQRVDRAEDLVQDAFLQIFKKLPLFRGESQFHTWAYRLLKNQFLMDARERKFTTQKYQHDRRIAGEDWTNLVVHDRRNSPSAMNTKIAVEQALATLPAGYRRAILLKDLFGLEHHEIANLLKNSMGGSKSQLSKARAAARRKLV